MKRPRDDAFWAKHFAGVHIAGRAYILAHGRILGHELDGLCEFAERRGRVAKPGRITVGAHLRIGGEKFIETTLHETIHALHPKWPERRVDREAKVLAEVLVTFLKLKR